MTALATPPLPILDEAVLDQVAAYLPEGRLATNLRRLASQVEALLEPLSADPSPGEEATLVELAHALAGGAGMLGFRRLSGLCLDYEVACSGAPDAPVPAIPVLEARGALRAALQDSLPAITRRIAG